MYKHYLFFIFLMVLVVEMSANDFNRSGDITTIRAKKKRADAYWKRINGSIDYMPLTGGTLTGTLYGTNGIFSGRLSSGGSSLASLVNFSIQTGPNTLLYAHELDANSLELNAVRQDNGQVKTLRIQHVGGATIFGGQVVIGSASEHKTLTIHGATSTIGGYNVKAIDNNDLPFVNFSNYDGTYNWGRIGGLLQGDGDGSVYISTKLGSYLTEKMRITSNGNVGIGTTTPSANFHIATPTGSASQVISGYGTNGSFLNFTNGGANTDLYIGTNNSTATLAGGVGGIYGSFISSYSSRPIGFGINGSEYGRLTPSGRWLFGTTIDDGSSIGQFNGNVHVSNSIMIGSIKRVFIRQSVGGDAEIGSADGGDTYLFNRGIVAQSFNWLGAATFRNNVTVTGGYIYGQSTNSYVRIDNPIGAQLAYVGGGTFIADVNGAYIGTGAILTNRLQVTTGGNVGIGINNPTEKLSVNGNVRAKKVIVSQTGWPDYVFDSSYSLRTLSEVEKFISSNKHLPDMPSAKEVEEKGISIGDNQTLLLKKIEELTLYVIDLQKQINLLNTKTSNK